MPPRPWPSRLYAIRPSESLRIPFSTPLNTRIFPRRPLISPKASVRPASNWGPQRPRPKPFENVQTFYYLWRTNPVFRLGVGVVGAGLGGFYYYNLEEVAISGRRRFNIYSPAQEAAQAESSYKMVMRQYGTKVLPPHHHLSEMVNKVLDRLIPAAGLEGQNWEVKVINDDNEMNAFVLPGNRVFVFSGIFPICAGEDGLAAILGHEIAHNIAHHTGEKLSHSFFLPLLSLALSYVLDIGTWESQSLVDLALRLPFSRRMESEADHIGLLMMAQACYDPRAAVGLWERMAQAEKFIVPQILSTHPASKKRMAVIEEWLPQAQQKRAESRCETTRRHMDGFTRMFAPEEVRGAVQRDVRGDAQKGVRGDAHDDDYFW